MATNLSNCNFDVDYVTKIEEWEMWFAWHIVTPVHFLLGTPGHILLLFAFYKQYKQESAYMYQVFATVSEFFELQFWTLLILTIHFLSGAEGGGVEWYKKSYACMWYAAHLAHATFSSFYTCSLLLSVAMSADRVFAMACPFKYKNINQRKHQIVGLLLCLLISVLTGFVDGLRYSVEVDGDGYKIVIKEEDVSSLLSVFLGHLRNVVRFLALIALIILNLILVSLFRKRFNQVNKLVGSHENGAKEKKRKVQERILLMLTVCQSCFQCLSVLSIGAYFAALYASPYFAMCTWGIFVPYVDMSIEMCDLLELYFTFAINKQFRQMVTNMFPCWKNSGSTTAVLSITNASRVGN